MSNTDEQHIACIHPQCILRDLRVDRDQRQAPTRAMPHCLLWTEFYSRCGHMVMTRRCRNDHRLWAGEALQDPALCCDRSCQATELGPRIYSGQKCAWCEHPHGLLLTTSVRSDRRKDVLSQGEIEDRFTHFARVAANADDQRQDAALRRRRQPENLIYAWRSFQLMTQRIDQLFQRPNIDRFYFVGPYDDQQLFKPLVDSSHIGGDDICGVCRENILDPAPVKLPCNHLWHVGCIRTWFRDHDSCPTCRRSFRILRYNEFEQTLESAHGLKNLCYEDCGEPEHSESQSSQWGGNESEGSVSEDESVINSDGGEEGQWEETLSERNQLDGSRFEGYKLEGSESELSSFQNSDGGEGSQWEGTLFGRNRSDGYRTEGGRSERSSFQRINPERGNSQRYQFEGTQLGRAQFVWRDLHRIPIEGGERERDRYERSHLERLRRIVDEFETHECEWAAQTRVSISQGDRYWCGICRVQHYYCYFCGNTYTR